MGQVIELRSTHAVREPAPNAVYRCARCGTDLWNLLADGRVRCADCEQECPFRTVHGADNGAVNRTEPEHEADNRE